MISFSIRTAKKATCLKLAIKASEQSTVIVKAIDHYNKAMVYFRLEVIGYDHKGYLFLPMPLTPEVTTIIIGTKDGSPVSLIENPKLVSLKTTPIPYPYNDQKCMDLYRFCENLAVHSYFCKPWTEYCPENLIYSKNNKAVCAKVPKDILEEDENGKIKVSSTPARVARPASNDQEDFIFIEISQRKRRKMTVYMCVAMLFHELGHYILDTSDEELADSFSRMIYFDRGYPKSEYLYSFINVFEPIKNKDGSINKSHDEALSNRLIKANDHIEIISQKYY